MNSQEGIYIFLSHSHDDVAAVRKLRNSLENRGFNPIMLYLHSLKRRSAIKRLLKNEIKAREWFVYCDSPTARKSKWVNWERKYAAKVKDRVRAFTVDITETGDWTDQLQRETERIERYTTVYMSYAIKDKELARLLRDKLAGFGYQVIFDADFSSGADYLDKISSMIDSATKNGFVLLLLTENSANRPYVHHEIAYAEHSGGMIVPVIAGNPELSERWQMFLKTRSALRVSKTPSESEISSIVNHMLDMTEF